MTTATARSPLPQLNMEVVPGIEGFDGEVGELATVRKQALRDAIDLRRAFSQAEEEIAAAKLQDDAAAADAAIAGDDDPGRSNEEKAEATADDLHRKAHVATLRANALADRLVTLLETPAAIELLDKLEGEVNDALTRRGEALRAADEASAEIEAKLNLGAGIERVHDGVLRGPTPPARFAGRKRLHWLDRMRREVWESR